MRYQNIARDIRHSADPAKGQFFQRFFKTGKGEYAEGDKFAGLSTPQMRLIARRFVALPLPEIAKLLKSPIHEERSVGGMILCAQYQRASEELKTKLYDFYLKHRAGINNWDLVDGTAPYLVGQHLLTRDRKILYTLAQAKSLWDRRIAIIATFAFIRKNDFRDTLKISEILLEDSHDLMHKAVGWMLREVGKRDVALLETFLKKHAATMPRTMLRYSIEKFPEARRKQYLAIKKKERPKA